MSSFLSFGPDPSCRIERMTIGYLVEYCTWGGLNLRPLYIYKRFIEFEMYQLSSLNLDTPSIHHWLQRLNS